MVLYLEELLDLANSPMEMYLPCGLVMVKRTKALTMIEWNQYPDQWYGHCAYDRPSQCYTLYAVHVHLLAVYNAHRRAVSDGSYRDWRNELISWIPL